MKIKASLFFSALLLIFASGCGNLGYLSKMGWHQSSILFHRVPVEEILQDDAVGVATKEKIRFIQEVKRYGEERLGLKRTGSYEKVCEIKGPVLYVITASEKDRLQHYSWDFPIVGGVSYKSFFTHKDVLKEKQALEGKGFDTFVQRAPAYSTLGWLNDPIFSLMLEFDEVTLAHLILHEMVHATLYFKGKSDFNERSATFIGNRGAIVFLAEKYGPESKEVLEAVHTQEDDLLFSKWVEGACRQLSGYYGKEISAEEKLRGREEIFRSIREDFRGMKVQFKTDCYGDFEKIELNNAVLLAYRRYFHRLEKFETLYHQMGKDLGKVIEFLKKVQNSGEKAALNSLLEESS
jgi:predicted aminopeptidase